MQQGYTGGSRGAERGCPGHSHGPWTTLRVPLQVGRWEGVRGGFPVFSFCPGGGVAGEHRQCQRENISPTGLPISFTLHHQIMKLFQPLELQDNGGLGF